MEPFEPMPSPTKILYEAKKPRPGTVIFTSATSFAIVASAFWVPLAFAWSARRIVSMDEKNSDEEGALERKKTELKKKETKGDWYLHTLRYPRVDANQALALAPSALSMGYLV